jgi:small neutral amino acid transporter SnatA (MarC family)
MPTSITAVLEFALLAITSVFFLVDPFAVIPMFLAVTANSPEEQPRRQHWLLYWLSLASHFTEPM